MANISLKELQKKTNLVDNPYTYIDIALDLQQTNVFISNNNTFRSIKGKDLEISPDEAAISNAIFNILNTRPGQRFLAPTFGCNLMGYIGLPITDRVGEQIGRTILQAIRVWEPRVTVDEVFVTGFPDRNEYNIDITITIPSLKKRDIKLIGVLTKNGILESRLS